MDVKVDDVSYLVERYERTYLVRSMLSAFSVKPKVEEILLLSQVSFRLKPGSVTALMGLGLGQKCLLECIALRQREGLMSGKISYDGAVRRNGIFKDIVLIYNLGSSHFESLTVFEYLYYGARLRIYHGILECRERARQAARTVGLEPTKRVGSLTEGQLRILDIAAELVSNPTLLVLIDPAEGLDAASKLDVLKVFNLIAKRVSMPTTVVYSTGGLSEDMFKLNTHLGIFIGNKLQLHSSIERLYSGCAAAVAVSNLLVQMSLILEDHQNKQQMGSNKTNMTEVVNLGHANALIKVIDELNKLRVMDTHHTNNNNIDSEEKKSSSFYYSNHHNQVILDRTVTKDEFFTAGRRLGEAGLPFRYKKTVMKELSILVMRATRFHFKNGLYLRMILIRLVIASLILGGITYQAGSSLSSNPSLVSSSNNLSDPNAYAVTSICFVVVAVSLVGTAFTVPYLRANLQLLQFEVASGLTSTFSTWLSLLIIELPLYFLASLVVGFALYEMLALPGGLKDFLSGCFCVLLVGYSLALNCAVWMKNIRNASLLFSTIAGVFLVFGGYLIQIQNLPFFWSWFGVVSYTRWAFESLLISSLGDVQDAQDYLQIYGFDGSSAGYCNSWLVLWLIGLQILIIIGLLPPLYKMNYFRQEQGNESNTTATEKSRKSSVLITTVFGVSSSIKASAAAQQRQDDGNTNDDLHYTALVDAVETGSTAVGKSKNSSIDSSNRYVSVDSSKRTLMKSVDVSGSSGYQPPEFPGSSSQTALVTSAAGSGSGGADCSSFSLANSEINPKHIPCPKAMITTLSFARIRYYQDYLLGPTSSQSLKQSDPVLNGISGRIIPGTCAAIIDGNNDNSSVILLQILAGLGQATGKISGVITANGQKLGPHQAYLNAAYIQKGDLPFISSLTVKEALRYAALLRRTDQNTCAYCQVACRRYFSSCSCSKSNKRGEDDCNSNSDSSSASNSLKYDHISDYERLGRSGDVDERVAEVLSLLGLDECADTTIGIICDRNHQESNSSLYTYSHSYSSYQQHHPQSSVLRTTMKYQLRYQQHQQGINAVQLRLLSIGCELLTRPGLIFVEDPFYALQWQEAEIVGSVLHSLANGKRTIVCSVSRPAWRCLKSTFHELFLLGSGLLLYSGGVEQAVDYFDRIGFERQAGQSALDYLLDIAADRGVLGMVGGKRGNALTPEDLADLYRSMAHNNSNNSDSMNSHSKGSRKGRNSMDMVFLNPSEDFSAADAATSNHLDSLEADDNSGNEEEEEDESQLTPLQLAQRQHQNMLKEKYEGKADELRRSLSNIPQLQRRLSHSSFDNNAHTAVWDTSDNDEDATAVAGKKEVVESSGSRHVTPNRRNNGRNLFTAALSTPEISLEKDKVSTRPFPITSADSGDAEKEKKDKTNNSKSARVDAVSTVTKLVRGAPAGPTAFVLLQRGMRLLLNDRRGLVVHLIKCILAGVLLGSIWYKVGDHTDQDNNDEGSVDNTGAPAIVALFSALYLALNVLIVDALEGVYRRKQLFNRESYVRASNYLAYYLIDPLPTQLLFSVGALITLAIVYFLVGLRPGVDDFLYLYFLVLASLYCNYSLAYLLSGLAGPRGLGLVQVKTLYSGVLLPLQLLWSGYLILLPSMVGWASWGGYINPMAFFLSGAVRSQCENNEALLGSEVSWSDVQNQYGFHIKPWPALVVVVAFGMSYKLLWLVILGLAEAYKVRGVRRKIIGMRKKVRRIITATLRWNRHKHGGGFGEELEDEGYGDLEFKSSSGTTFNAN